jgi:hypothetical protein
MHTTSKRGFRTFRLLSRLNELSKATSQSLKSLATRLEFATSRVLLVKGKNGIKRNPPPPPSLRPCIPLIDMVRTL